jgi:hypothetical protein
VFIRGTYLSHPGRWPYFGRTQSPLLVHWLATFRKGSTVSNRRNTSKQTAYFKPADLRHHPLYYQVFGRRWKAAALNDKRYADDNLRFNIEALPDGHVILGNDHFEALAALYPDRLMCVLVRNDLADKGPAAIYKRMAQDKTYKGFQSPLEKFKALLLKHGMVGVLAAANDDRPFSYDDIDVIEDNLPRCDVQMLLAICPLKEPLSYLLHADLLSPEVGHMVAGFSWERLRTISERLGFHSREAEGREFQPADLDWIDELVLGVLKDGLPPPKLV